MPSGLKNIFPGAGLSTLRDPCCRLRARRSLIKATTPGFDCQVNSCSSNIFRAVLLESLRDHARIRRLRRHLTLFCYEREDVGVRGKMCRRHARGVLGRVVRRSEHRPVAHRPPLPGFDNRELFSDNAYPYQLSAARGNVLQEIGYVLI